MRLLTIGCVLAMGAAFCVAAQAQGDATPVTVKDNGTTWTLSNAYVTATISKTTGDMTSLKYKGLETMGYVSGHHAGYWEQNPSGAKRLDATVTIDPAANGGERGEVSVKGWSDGESLTAHPRRGPREAPPAADDGEPAEPAAPRAETPQLAPGRAPGAGTRTNRPAGGGGPGLLMDMEIRYTLGRDDHGIYTYAIFTHQPSYGATQLGESRYGFKLSAQVFDWLSIDKNRNTLMPTGHDWDMGSDLNAKEARRLTTGVFKGKAEHKYDYCAVQFEIPAFGWSGTKSQVGLYFINPSMEYLSSGPFHVELTGHLDDGDGGDPTLLDYWRGTHYGGSELPVKAGEDWNKVVGPIFVYLDSGATPDAMFAQAQEQAKVEAAKWPYAWVKGVDYPLASQRATVSGQMVLKDPQAATTELPNLRVGLAYPDEVPIGSDQRGLNWQNDAKHYEFWVRGSSDGKFTIPKVRAGTYELHAIADGVLGEYQKANVTVTAGGQIDLGKLDWTPVRYGQQVFQIGVPNRSASEFFGGNNYWHWGLYINYSQLFPKDVDYTVGKSNWAKDWFIYQVPHAEQVDATGRGKGRATTWTIHFNVGREGFTSGKATLRLALVGVGTKEIDVGVNGKSVGQATGLVYNATINRDGIEGSWVEKDVTFDAKKLHAGENTLTLTVPEGGLTSGVAYDVVRLEVGDK
jgi:rhamnogalacturonan endolyase